jgi:hypothetical protein
VQKYPSEAWVSAPSATRVRKDGGAIRVFGGDLNGPLGGRSKRGTHLWW